MWQIAVQIVNYKTQRELSDCIVSLQKILTPEIQIYVLDNNSWDDLTQLEVQHPHVHFLYAKINKGFGWWHNEIAKHHQADIMIMLNPDCKIIEADSLQRLVAQLSDSSVGAIGPKLVTSKGNWQRWDHGNRFAYANDLLIKLWISYWRKDKKPLDVNRVCGACFVIKKELFDKMGWFDERFFMYKEEEDLCYRIRKLWMKIRYDPTISVSHIGWVTHAKRYMISSNVLFIRKHLFHW